MPHKIGCFIHCCTLGRARAPPLQLLLVICTIPWPASHCCGQQPTPTSSLLMHSTAHRPTPHTIYVAIASLSRTPPDSCTRSACSALPPSQLAQQTRPCACDNCIARSTLRHHRHHHRILLFCCELRGHQMPQQGAWPSRGCQQQYGAVAGSTMTALHLRTLLHKYTTKCDWHITCLHMAYSGTSI